jgi:hypothetical protein
MLIHFGHLFYEQHVASVQDIVVGVDLVFMLF